MISHVIMQFRLKQSAMKTQRFEPLTLYGGRGNFDDFHIAGCELASETESKCAESSLGGGIRWHGNSRNDRKVRASAIPVSFSNLYLSSGDSQYNACIGLLAQQERQESVYERHETRKIDVDFRIECSKID
jgi:hypothetical protein